MLNAQLADSSNMLSFMKHPHCNVKGPQFIALHELFDEIAAGLLSHVDTLVECATAPGGMALDTTTRILSSQNHLGWNVIRSLLSTVLTLSWCLRTGWLNWQQMFEVQPNTLNSWRIWIPMICSQRFPETWISGSGSSKPACKKKSLLAYFV